MTTMSPGKLLGLTRLADETGRFKMLAVDQRPPIEDLVRRARGTSSATFADVVRVKELLLENLAPYASASLLDPQYIFPGGLPKLPRGSGLLITLEYEVFEETPGGRKSRPIADWTVQKIQAAGGDAVKLLAWYRPDASRAVREHQKEFVADVGSKCARLDIPFVLELLLYPFPSEESHTSSYVEHPHKHTDQVLESIRLFADPVFGVDLFKLESPVPATSVTGADALGDATLSQAFREVDEAAGRPWVVLSAGAEPAGFRRILELAFDAGASGYLAGRAIWWQSCNDFFPDDAAVVRSLQQRAVPYMKDINSLTDDRAMPWTAHRSYGAEGPTPPMAGDRFRVEYLA